MTATLDYGYRIFVDAENNSVFLINADAGVSAEIPFEYFGFSIGTLIAVPHDVLQQFIDLFSDALSACKLSYSFQASDCHKRFRIIRSQ